MKSLRNQDLTSILESVRILNSDADAATLPARLISAVRNSVSTEFTAFDGWNGAGNHLGTTWFDPPESIPPYLLEIFAAHAAEHPLVTRLIGERNPETLKVTDFLSPGQFQRTGLFNEFYKKIGVAQQISTRLEIEKDLAFSCTLSRDRKDFDERDRSALDLLKPHLVTAIRNSRLIETLKIEREYVDQIATRGIAVLDWHGRIKFLNMIATNCLYNYFDDFINDTLPETISNFVNSSLRTTNGIDYYSPVSVMTRRKPDSELRIRVILDHRREEIKLIFDESKELSSGDFKKLGFTSRESEIIYFLSGGKTDETIGIMCGISPRTVQKHMEHIFRKLGVETRTAASRMALELLSQRQF